MTQIANATDVGRVMISPDGQQVAFTIGSPNENGLFVVDVAGENGRMLIKSSDLAPLRGVDTAESALLISQVQWLPNSQGLAFNTDLINLIGPGIFNQEDLWMVELNGNLTQIFNVGELGGIFDISNGNKIIAGGAEKIVLANLDGSGREEVVSYELVNTASEYIYYPQPHWVANGSRAFVAVPNREQFSRRCEFHAV